MDIAIITAAGYKGVATQFNVPQFCPESLLPVGDTTILGRLCRQLKDFYKIIVVGSESARYNKVVGWNAKLFKFEADGDVQPWTQERIEYARGLGDKLIFIDDPDFKTMQDSVCYALDSIDFDYDKLVITPGDHLYTDGFLADVLSAPFPRQYSSCRKRRGNVMFVLNQDTAKVYRQYAQTHRTRGMKAWFGNKWDEFGDYIPPGEKRSTGTMFSDICPLFYARDIHHGEWEFPSDIDYPNAYREASDWYDMINSQLAKTNKDWQDAQLDGCENKTGLPWGYQWGHGAIVEEVMPVVRRFIGNRVLEIGCGGGKWTKALCDIAKVTATDSHSTAIRQSMEFEPRAEYHVTNGETLPFADKSFDTVFTWDVLLHLPMPLVSQYMREARRVAKRFIFALPDILSERGKFMYNDAVGKKSWRHPFSYGYMTYYTKEQVVALMYLAGWERVYDLGHVGAPEKRDRVFVGEMT